MDINPIKPNKKIFKNESKTILLFKFTAFFCKVKTIDHKKLIIKTGVILALKRLFINLNEYFF